MPSVTYLLLMACGLTVVSGCMRVTPTEPGMPAMNCKSCMQSIIMVTQNGAGAHAFDSMTPDNSGACTKIPYVCKGPSASIAINNPGDGEWGDANDGTEDGVATVTVECNAAGTAWTFMGIPITRLECASGVAMPSCKTCAQDLITITQAGDGAKPFTSMMLDTSGACAQIPYVCEGPGASIAINGPGQGEWGDDADGAVDMKAQLTVECNAAGTAWTFMGIDITQLECSSGREPGSCNTNCGQNILDTAVDPNNPLTRPMTNDNTVMANGCSTRTLMCTGTRPNIEINGGAGNFADADDGNTDGTVNFVLMCIDGAWQYMGAAVTQAVCRVAA